MSDEPLNLNEAPPAGAGLQAGELGPATGHEGPPGTTPGRAMRRHLSQGGNILLVGLFSAGLAVVYLLSLRAGPARASAEQIQMEYAVDTALTELTRTTSRAGAKTGTDVADVFYYEARSRQIPLAALPGNPFVFKVPMDKPVEAFVQTQPAVLEQNEAIEITEALAALKGLQLQSVMTGARGASAMISNNLLAQGQVIRGWTVSEIHPDRVVLRCREQTYVLRMSE